MEQLLQQLVNALSLGSTYALIALGVAIVFSILGLINFAHGELLTVAGYTMFILIGQGVPWVLTLPAAILASMVAAVLLERVAFRPVRGAAPVTLLLTSFAVSFVLQNVFLLFIGERPKALQYPDWIDAKVRIGSVFIVWLDVVTLATTAVVLIALTIFLRKTVIGLALRSAATDLPITRLMGIRVDRIVLGAFLVSGALAGLAAIFTFGESPVVTPTSGFNPLIKGFIASVIGGLGSLPGAVLGAFLLAFFEVALEGYLPPRFTGSVDAMVFAILIAILLFRPHGILGSRSVVARA